MHLIFIFCLGYVQSPDVILLVPSLTNYTSVLEIKNCLWFALVMQFVLYCIDMQVYNGCCD